MASKPEIIVGIDFGTTYSGFSWAVNSGLKVVHLVKDWENTQAYSVTDDKVRTWISYTDNRPSSFGNTAVGKPFKWFKILLQPESYVESENEIKNIQIDAKQGLEAISKTPEDVIADYLRWIWNRGKADIARKQGYDFENRYNLRVVLTVPAAWKPIAKEKTLKAARTAGLPDRTDLVTEPEAAALATLTKRSDNEELKEDDVFVVCDAGGGTVDLISYQVVEAKPLKLRECGVGEGGLCGSAFLDSHFEKIIKTKIGETRYYGTKPKHRKEMMIYFENVIKRNFDGDLNQVYEVELRGSGNNPDEDDDDNISIAGTAICTAFDTVCDEIDTLVNNQVKQANAEGLNPKAILLVGGFGSSKYLHSRLRRAYEPQGIRVLQAEEPWSAVCRGATMWGLENKVISRTARFSYGYSVNVVFDAKIHEPRDQYFDLSEGRYRARDQMVWLLNRKDNIKEGQVLIWKDYNGVRENELSSNITKTFVRNLYYCELDNPPTRKSEGVIPMVSVEFKIESSRLLRTTQSRKGADGSNWRDVHFQMEISLRNADLGFTVYYNGEKVGYMEAKYLEDR